MQTAIAPSGTELRGRAEELIPLLRRNARSADDERRMAESSIEAMRDAGLLRMRVPRHLGGFESDMSTVVNVLAAVARGDGSASWTLSVWAISTWMLSLFPDEVQDEVFATPDVRVCGILSPGATVEPTQDGFLLNGRWPFSTAATQSDWATNAAVLIGPDGTPQPVMVLVPTGALGVIDDWHTSGMRATGSVTTTATNVHVPHNHVLPLGPVFQGQHRSARNAGSRIYQAPFMATACATVGAPALGLAQGARDAFMERLPGRSITYTSYANQSEAPLTHLQVAETSVLIAEAEHHVEESARMLDAGRPAADWSIEERARIRLLLGAVCRRSKEAVDILNGASGGSSIYADVPIQRIARDIQTLNLHGILNPMTNFELYGRIALGLSPNTNYL